MVRAILFIFKILNTKPSKWWLIGKSLGSKGLFLLWSQIRVLWLLMMVTGDLHDR